jgi:hypothetical protein
VRSPRAARLATGWDCVPPIEGDCGNLTIATLDRKPWSDRRPSATRLGTRRQAPPDSGGRVALGSSTRHEDGIPAGHRPPDQMPASMMSSVRAGRRAVRSSTTQPIAHTGGHHNRSPPGSCERGGRRREPLAAAGLSARHPSRECVDRWPALSADPPLSSCGGWDPTLGRDLPLVARVGAAA